MPIVPKSDLPDQVANYRKGSTDLPFSLPPGSEAKTGFWTNLSETAGISSVLSTLAGKTLPAAVQDFYFDEVDPGFDPWKLYNNNDYFNDHPWMYSAFTNGLVDDVHNQSRYALLEESQKSYWDASQRIGRHGAFAPSTLLGGLAGGLIDAPLAFAGGVGGSAAKWAETGTVLARLAKGGVVGAIGNVAQEEALRILNPGKPEPRLESDVMAAGFGFLGGAVISGIAQGFNKATGKIQPRNETARQVDSAILNSKGDFDQQLKVIADEGTMARMKMAETPLLPKAPETIAADRRASLKKPVSTVSDVDATRAAVTGKPYTATVHRGVGPGTSALDTSGTVGNALFLTPDIETAKVYSSPTNGGSLDSFSISLDNPLVANNWFEAKKALGLPKSTDMAGLIESARKIGHDGIVFTFNHNKNFQPEVVSFSPKSLSTIEKPAPAAEFTYNHETGRAEYKDTLPSQGVGATTQGVTGPLSEAGAVKQAARGNKEPLPTRWLPLATTEKEKAAIAKVKAEYGDLYDLQDHPGQSNFDSTNGATYRPANIGWFNRYAELMKGVGFIAPPAVKVERAKGTMSRMIGRLLFNYANPTQEALDNPLAHVSTRSGADYKGLYDARFYKAINGMRAVMDRHLADGPITYTMNDGTVLEIKSKYMDRSKFGQAVGDYLRTSQTKSEASAMDAALVGQGTPDLGVHPAIKEAAELNQGYYRDMGGDMHGVGLLDKLPDEDKFYMTRKWLGREINARWDEWVGRMVEDQKKWWAVDKSKKEIPLPDRIVEREAVQYTGRRGNDNGLGLTKEDRDIIEQNVLSTIAGDPEKKPTKEQIDQAWAKFDVKSLGSNELIERYLQEAELFYKARAESMGRTLTKSGNEHGLPAAMSTPSVTKHKIELYDESAFSDFLEGDAFEVMKAYHYKMHGDIALRRAVKDAEPMIGKAVANVTGKPLADHQYDPAVLIDLAKADYDHQIRAATDLGDKKLAAEIQIEKDRMIGVDNKPGMLAVQIDAMRGRHYGRANNRIAQFTARSLNDMIDMSMLGTSAMSNYIDAAGAVLHKNWTPRMLRDMADMLTLTKRATKGELEGFMVLADDHLRTILNGEASDPFDGSTDGNYGFDLFGRVAGRVSKGLDIAKDAFYTANTSRRVNATQKMFFGKAAMVRLLESSRKLLRASEMIKAGEESAVALRKVGLDKFEAAWLSNNGISVDVARRIGDTIEKYGVDIKGEKIKSFKDHEGYIDPKGNDWGDKPEFRDVNESMSSVINAAIGERLSEPKDGYRFMVGEGYLGVLFNKFTSFMHTWGARAAYSALTSGPRRAFAYFMSAFGMGAIISALRDKLTGRRDLDETINGWQKNPLGESYRALVYSPLLGWLGRPLGMLDTFHIGPSRVVGAEPTSRAYGRTQDIFDAHPATAYVRNLFKAAQSLKDFGHMSDAERKSIWRALPWGNIWWLRMGGRVSEALGYDRVPLLPPPAK